MAERDLAVLGGVGEKPRGAHRARCPPHLWVRLKRSLKCTNRVVKQVVETCVAAFLSALTFRPERRKEEAFLTQLGVWMWLAIACSAYYAMP